MQNEKVRHTTVYEYNDSTEKNKKKNDLRNMTHNMMVWISTDRTRENKGTILFFLKKEKRIIYLKVREGGRDRNIFPPFPLVAYSPDGHHAQVWSS